MRFGNEPAGGWMVHDPPVKGLKNKEHAGSKGETEKKEEDEGGCGKVGRGEGEKGRMWEGGIIEPGGAA